jgi:hypothetical protein
MVGARHPLVVAGAVVAILFGMLLHAGLPGNDPPVDGAGHSPVAVVEWSPPGVMPVAVRARAWAEGELVSVTRALTAPRAALLSPLAWAAAVAAVASWCLWRCDHRFGRGVPGSPLASRRAPPAS